MKPALLIAPLALAALLAPRLGAEEAAAIDYSSLVHSTVIDMEPGKRCLRQELVVDASLDDVWRAFTTRDGLEAWMAPVVDVDFRLGGTLKSHYDPAAEIGHPGTVTITYVNYVPQHLLTLRSDPDQWPVEIRGDVEHTYEVIEIEPLDEGRTRIVSWGIGYGDSPAWNELLDFFVKGNAWSYGLLAKRFKEGPIDWTAMKPPEPDSGPGSPPR